MFLRCSYFGGAAQIDQRCVPMQPTTEGRNGVQPTPMLLGLCDPSVNSLVPD